MKNTGKTFNDIPIYTDPEVPKDKLYLLNGLYIDKNPRRSGKLEGIYEPPKRYGFWRKLSMNIGWRLHGFAWPMDSNIETIVTDQEWRVHRKYVKPRFKSLDRLAFWLMGREPF